jgi:drug/metabolite transporter (DMT)-like permease
MEMHSASAAHHRQGYLYGILMAGVGSMLFSGKAILVKLAFGYGANAETLLALRMLMALPLFWGIFWWESRRKAMSPITWTDRTKLFFLGFLGYFLSSYIDFLGLQYISVGLERIIFCFEEANLSVAVVLFSSWLYRCIYRLYSRC